MSVTRRHFIASALPAVVLAAMARQPALAQDAPLQTEDATEFRDDTVVNLARKLAAKPYVDDKLVLPAGFDALTYDQYRAIRFNSDKALWKGEPHQFSVELFHSGFLFNRPVDIYLVQGTQQAKLKYDPGLFQFGKGVPVPDGKTDLHYSGVRLRYPLNDKSRSDEFAVFQGASYFRAVGQGLHYGLSARGLAIDTGQPSGEEFPYFRAFWIKQPEAPTGMVVVEALLDSPSVSGAYRFTIKPGADTQMDVELTLFTRKDMAHLGIAPLTSMFLFDALARNADDYRTAVHDSDGLMMQTGRGEWLWRPLANPKGLQISAFQDLSPRGFGLMQRSRQYADYLDPEAQYERRPSLWVEPVGDWGAGAVELYEIPTHIETNDNIVAFWRQQDTLVAGSSRSYVYRLHWAAQWPLQSPAVSLVSFSGSGVDYDYADPTKHDPNFRLYVVEFDVPNPMADYTATVNSSAGEVKHVAVYRNEMNNRVRVSFRHDVTGVDLAELRMDLMRATEKAGETWLYRWTRP